MSDVPQSEKSFLAQLLTKQASVLVSLEHDPRKSVRAAVAEVKRQTKQALNSSNPLVGEGVTKSGDED